VVAARSFARRLREAVAAASPGDTSTPSTIRSLATQVATVLDDTTRRLGGTTPAGTSDPIEGVDASASALVRAIGTYTPDDWRQDRSGASAIDVLRSGIAEASKSVRQATAMTESSG